MANISEYGTKTLSVRLTTKDYVKIIETAENKKLSTSEYIHLKLFKEEQDTVTPLMKEIADLKASNAALQKELSAVNSALKTEKKSYSDLLVKWQDLVAKWNKQQADLKAKK